MAVECAHCKSQNSDDKRFCGDCGAPLDSVSSALKGLSGTELRDQVDQIIREHYKDQKIVEIETAQAVASRLLDWAKLLGFFVGIPVTVLLLILGVLGISKYSDFSGKIDTAQADIGTKLTEAQNSLAKAQANGDSLGKLYDQLSARYENTKAVADKLDALTKQVDALERLAFTPSSNISEAAKAKLLGALLKFQQHLKDLGYKGTVNTVDIDIRDKIESISYYDPDKHMMVIDSKYAANSVILFREYAHHVLLGTAAFPSDEEWAYYAIESGLAWYLPCSFVDNPKPAPEATSWDLTSKRKFEDLRPTYDSAVDIGTEVWGSVFWELRQLLGKSGDGQYVADKLLFDTWFKLRPDEVIADRGASFVRILLELDNKDEAQIRAVFDKRGFPR
jgi:F0F1-type ATP synthase membrane subunit b/b'